MTQGKPAKLILTFSIPLMLGNMFQQFYTVTDTVIVSRALGVDALAALGSVDWYTYLIAGMVQAVTQGFAILIAQRFGAADREGLRRGYTQSLILCLLIGAALTAAACLSVFPAMHLLQVPEKIRPMARRYVLILYAGVPAQLLFNFAAAMLRALGNSKTPLHAMIVSSLVNIGLDLWFVLGFGWGVSGAAAATVMAQLLAGLFCLAALRQIGEFRFRPREREPGLRAKLLRLCAPMVLQNLLIGVGGMIVVYVVNGLGVTFIAGYTATNKLYGMLEMAAVAYGFSMVTYVGQNYGAHRWDRIRGGYRAAMWIALGTGVLTGAVMILSGRQIGQIFLPGTGAETLSARAVAYRYLVIMGAALPILYVLHVARSTLQGLGDTVMPMISGIAEFAMRTAMALLAVRYLGGDGIMYGEVAAWLGADLVLVPARRRRFREDGRSEEEERKGCESADQCRETGMNI